VLATDAIAARAYQIFVRRGGGPGNPVDDWRRAEAELRAEKDRLTFPVATRTSGQST
jgi:hypothetical protein